MNIKFACWVIRSDSPADDDNCQCTCQRKEITYTSPKWFDGWVTSDSSDCKNRIIPKTEINDLFNKFYGKI